MGGVYRSDESLTLAFPPFVWKLIVGEHVTWAKDYVAIDEAAVHITGESTRETHHVARNYFSCKLSRCMREFFVISSSASTSVFRGGRKSSQHFYFLCATNFCQLEEQNTPYIYMYHDCATCFLFSNAALKISRAFRLLRD